MTDDPQFESERERELWAASLARLQAHASDPRAGEGLEPLAEQILAAHRAKSTLELRPASPRRSPRTLIVGGLAAAATIAVIVLASRPDSSDSSLARALPMPDQPDQPDQPLRSEPKLAPVEPRITQPAGPPLDRAGLLTFTSGVVEQTTELIVALAPGATIQPGVTISTAAEGETCLRWTSPFAVVCVGGHARFELVAESEPSTRRIRLLEGRLVAVLDPLAPGQRFEVTTSLGSVAAIGTVFVVEVSEAEITASVFEGEVELDEAGSLRRLGAERGVPLGVAAEPSAIDGELRARAEVVSARAELWREPLARMGGASWTSSHAVELDGHPLGAGSLALLLTAGAHHLHAEGSELALDILDIEADALRALGELAKRRPSKQPAPTEHNASELARLAQQARMARNYPETARLYRELIDRYPESPEASNVPVRLGDLLLKTGDHAGALAAYDLYLERGGQLEPEARFGRIKALRGLARAADEAAAIAEFLREHADDYRVEELQARQAELD